MRHVCGVGETRTRQEEAGRRQVNAAIFWKCPEASGPANLGALIGLRTHISGSTARVVLLVPAASHLLH